MRTNLTIFRGCQSESNEYMQEIGARTAAVGDVSLRLAAVSEKELSQILTVLTLVFTATGCVGSTDSRSMHGKRQASHERFFEYQAYPFLHDRRCVDRLPK
jgi:hypothetical protein